MWVRASVCTIGCALALVSGCTAPRAELYGPRDASRVIPGMKRVSSVQDREAAAELVRDLESDDAAVRLFAIHTLERLTGDRMGYIYYAEEADRRPAVTRWRDWLEGKQIELPTATTQPSSNTGGGAMAGKSGA